MTMAQTLVFQTVSSTLADSVQLISHAVPQYGTDEILIRMLAAPLNPIDLLVLQDKYPVKPQSFMHGKEIPGYDGAAVIVGLGDNVKGFQIGDTVIIKRHGLGTWRTHAALHPQDIVKVPQNLEPQLAAILRMGVMPAYLLLEENRDRLGPGDWIIQNGATGVITHFVAQFARLQGLRIISVVRNRSNMESVKRVLQSHGANLVIQEQELLNNELFVGKRIMLGLDAVFGIAGQNLVNRLSPGATYVTYGFLGAEGMKGNLSITAELIWTKNIIFRGFRLSNTIAARSDQEQLELYDWFADLLCRNQLTRPSLEFFEWGSQSRSVEELEKGLKDIIREASSGDVGKAKTMLLFEKSGTSS